MLLGSCSHQVGDTTVAVEDSVRHYYPVVLGQQVKMNWTVRNTGENPLIITDIQPDGSLTFDEQTDEKIIVPPGGKLHLPFTYNSDRNLGYVHSYIRIFGNIRKTGICVLEFDLNVVPPEDFIPDYEQTFSTKQSEAEKANIGKEQHKGYYTDVPTP